MKLIELAASYTDRNERIKWSKVVKSLVGRTDSNAARRHNALMKGLEPGALQCACTSTINLPTNSLVVSAINCMYDFHCCILLPCRVLRLRTLPLHRLKVGRKPKDKADRAPRKRAKRKRVADKEDDEVESEADTHEVAGSKSAHSLRSGLRMRTRTTIL